MKKVFEASFLAGGVLLASATAHAHVSISSAATTSGVGIANATQEVAFGVGHGCNGTDTVKLVIEIPAGVKNVRPMRSDFATPTVVTDGGGNVTSVTWQKPDAEALPADTAFYKFVIRMQAPNTPFTKLLFLAHQTCIDGTTEDWILPPGSDAGTNTGPALTLMPARSPGWNKYTVPAAITDMKLFNDAAIVWKGNAAYSGNPSTLAQIKAEPGVTELTSLAAGDEIWVRY